jgi:hypothetical protein
VAGDRAHIERIGHDDALVAQLLPQCRNAGRGERSWQLLRFQGWHVQMPQHHAANSRANCCAEGLPFALPQRLPIYRERGELFVRIHPCCAMPGEVLGASPEPLCLRSLNPRSNVRGSLGCRLSKGANADDGILRLACQVTHRRQVPGDANATGVSRNPRGNSRGQLRLPQPPQRKSPREGNAILKAHRQAVLQVRSHHQRIGCKPHQFSNGSSGVFAISAEEANPS